MRGWYNGEVAEENKAKGQGQKEVSQNGKKPAGGLRIGFGQIDKNGARITKEFNLNFRKFFVWILVMLLFVPALFTALGNMAFKQVSIPLSQAVADIRAGKVDKVQVSDQELILYYKEGVEGTEGPEGKIRTSRKEAGESLAEVLDRNGINSASVQIEVAGKGLAGSDIMNIGLNGLFLVGSVLFFLWMMRMRGGGMDPMFGFGKSNAKLFTKGKQNIRFSDVGGLKEAKQEVEEIVDFLKHPKKYQKLGARTPKGVLLIGPSGTGKTLLARAIAGEADVPFYSMAGSEFMEMLVGVGASRVRDLFSTAKAHTPSIIFIDEIDAIGQARGPALTGGHGEREQTLNQILVEMDGFEPNEQVVVCAASNRPDVLDSALIRPGRFDRRVILDLPDLDERQKILLLHAKNKPITNGFSWEKVAKRTVGFSGADLENMLNEAAIMAARKNAAAITMEDIEEAATKVKLGPEKRRLQSALERKMTAYHEAGHAVVAHNLVNTDPVHRISIVSRGMALGFTEMAPLTDKVHQTRSELLEKMAAMLGGRAAEQLIFNELTGGASSDIDRVTQVARKMVVYLGMSNLGPIDFGHQYDTTEYGQRYYEPSSVSDKTQQSIDEEIKRLVDNAYKSALEILNREKKPLDRVAAALVEKETLDGEEFAKLVGRPKAAAQVQKSKTPFLTKTTLPQQYWRQSK